MIFNKFFEGADAGVDSRIICGPFFEMADVPYLTYSTHSRKEDHHAAIMKTVTTMLVKEWIG